MLEYEKLGYGSGHKKYAMKLLVFAHTPPPHHGQSYMVELMLAGFGGDQHKDRLEGASSRPGGKFGITCYHVNARLSRNLEDIGEFRMQKVLLLLGYCLRAIWCRFRYGVTTLYYVPSPGKRSALVRDWLVMQLCRPFFRKVVLHWHAAGLAKWLETVALKRTRAITYRLMKGVDLSVVLSNCNAPDAEKLWPRQIKVVPNGIPDPCPDFQSAVLPRRLARIAARKKLLAGQSLTPADLDNTGGDPQVFKVLFLAHCTRDKGLFDTMDGVALANQKLSRARSPIRLHLTVAGAFLNPREHVEFAERLAKIHAQPEETASEQWADNAVPDQPSGSWISYTGFVNGAAKSRIFAENDCFCFPSYYYAESFGLVIVEAMAFGMSIVASRWRSIPEVLPPDYAGLVSPRSPQQVAGALLAALSQSSAELLRERFVKNFTVEQYLAGLAQAIQSVEEPAELSARAPVPCAS